MKVTMLLLMIFLLTSGMVSAGDEKGWKKFKCPKSSQECLDDFVAEYGNVPWDGIRVGGLGPETPMHVKEIEKGSPGEASGILPGDILHEVNGKPMGDMDNDDLVAAMAALKIGDTVTYTIIRGEKTLKIKCTMAAFPMETLAKHVGKHMLMHHADQKLMKQYQLKGEKQK